MIPLGKPNDGPLDYLAPIAAGTASVEPFGTYLRRACQVCGWRRLLLRCGAVICTKCFGRAAEASGKVDNQLREVAP